MLKSKTQKDEEYLNVLFKLCAEIRPILFTDIDFYTNLSSSECFKNIQILLDNKRYHAVAFIYNIYNRQEDALNIWKEYKILQFLVHCSYFIKHILKLRLTDRIIEDQYFPGLDYLIEELCKLKDHQLVWKYFDWVMKIDETKGVRLFTKRAVDELTSERMRIDTILDNLIKYKVALTLYLEHLIFIKNNKVY
jgi:hypothetical protein